MTNHPHTTGETLEQLLERILFEDPATHRLRDEWAETKRTEQEVFDRVCREEYECRLEYHRICQSPDPEAMARHETSLCRILFKEELDTRLAERWANITQRLRAVLADKTAERAETPDTGSGSDTGDNPGT
jgi:hypothetical protein